MLHIKDESLGFGVYNCIIKLLVFALLSTSMYTLPNEAVRICSLYTIYTAVQFVNGKDRGH